MSKVCSLCSGKKHVRIPGTFKWTRCSCALYEIARGFIKPKIRQGRLEPSIDVGLWSFDYRQSAVAHTLPFELFTQIVWKSLLRVPNSELRYDFIEAYRLVEIYLQQDTTYDRVRDLEDLELLIICLGVSEPPNKMLGPLISQILTQRLNADLPTWVYCSGTLASIPERYGSEVKDVIFRLIGSSSTPLSNGNPISLTFDPRA